MIAYRLCSKIGCSQPAIATLTYSHADQIAYLGPIAEESEPHKYDLCFQHSQSLTPPRGWEIVRQPLPSPDEAQMVIAKENPARNLGVRRAEDLRQPLQYSEQEHDDAYEGYDADPQQAWDEDAALYQGSEHSEDPETLSEQSPAPSRGWLSWGRDR